MLARRSAQTVTRAARRYYSTGGQAQTFQTSPGNEFMAQRAAVKEHAKDTTRLWRNISFFVCIPVAIGGFAWTYKLEAEHEHHLDHIREENGGELPAPPAYDYLNIRNKPFPWGMQSLFFNPEVNHPAGDE